MEENDDVYELYEEYLDDDEISPHEEGFIRGFIESDKQNELIKNDEDPDNLELEIDEIQLKWELDSDEEAEDGSGAEAEA